MVDGSVVVHHLAQKFRRRSFLSLCSFEEITGARNGDTSISTYVICTSYKMNPQEFDFDCHAT